MKNIRASLGNILEQLNRSDALPELNPKLKGRYTYLTCPQCSQSSAYISNNGYYIYCNRQNNCGYVNGIVEYIAERDHISNDSAVEILAKITGTSLPEISPEEQEKYKKMNEKEQLLKDILAVAKTGLWKYGGTVINYLRNRGYQDNEIIEMDFGYLPVIDELKKYLRNRNHSFFLIEEIVDTFSNRHPLLIPVFNQYGILDGFVTRAIESEITPKYLYSKGLERGSYFFNFYNAKKSDTLIIVEGIIDALLLTQRGISGVVACGGDSPTQAQISQAFNYHKFQNTILFLDNDKAGKNGTDKAIELLNDYNTNIYVATSHPYKDPDEYLKNHSIDELQKQIFRALNSVKWLTQRTIEQYDINNDIEKDKIINNLLQLESKTNNPIHSEYIINYLINEFGINPEAITTYIHSYRDKYNREKLAEMYKNILKNANKMQNNAEYDKLFEYLNTNLNKVKAVNSHKIITPYSIDKALNDIQKRKSGLDTGFESIDKYLNIPNGAVTLVAGRPSHGKTTFLLNLYLNMIEKYPKRSFYLFSYEESKTALYIKIINILAESIVNEQLKFKNTNQIEYYLKNEQTYNENINFAVRRYNQYVQEGRLWLIDEALDINVLAGVIQNAHSMRETGAIFVDYAQRIKFSAKYDSERIKIARISETLRETATTLDIPLIVGAQLNRENAKMKPQLDNLKEAGNLEEDANIVLGLYNWKTAIDKEKADEEFKNDKRKKLLNCKGKEVVTTDREIDFEVHILKNRNGSINENALLKFDAPILKIKENIINNYSPF